MWSIFDYAVVVANVGTKEAVVTVTGAVPTSPSGDGGVDDAGTGDGGTSDGGVLDVNKQVTVPPGELRKIYLPWVPELKGVESDACFSGLPTLESSVVVPHGAYHLVSSSPVIVYQFNALQYQPVGGEGPDGGPKDWSTCPVCPTYPDGGGAPRYECLSYTNDASLLIPTTAMSTNYRVTAFAGYPTKDTSGTSAALTVTATQPNTKVTVTLSATASLLASKTGPAISAKNASEITTFTLAEAGDVAELVGGRGMDFSGSLIQSDKPVQVIAADPCMSIPFGKASCDHLEETVLPAETLGKQYVVGAPTGPKGKAVGYVARFYGNVNGTKLTYKPSRPTSCPASLQGGTVVECGPFTNSFEVTGDKEFAVSTFLLGQSQYESDRLGDPSQTNIASVEQYRTKYVFLAPDDYPVQYADITAPKDTEIVLDGQPLTAPFEPIGTGDFGIYRADLTKSGQGGAHSLTSKKPVGVQVIGFGKATSFQYPAGLNLYFLAPPPPK